MARLSLFLFLAINLFFGGSRAEALPCKYDEWAFDNSKPEACVRTKEGKVGDIVQSAKLTVGCETGALFIEVAPANGFGPSKRRDKSGREKFDKGERLSRIWLFDADRARLEDFNEVRDFVEKLQSGERDVVMTGGDGADKDYRFRFSLMKSTSEIRKLKEVCRPR